MLGGWKKSIGGGREVFTYNLLDRLKSRGHTVVLYVSFESYTSNKAFYKTLPYEVRPLFVFTLVAGRIMPSLLMNYICGLQQKHSYDLWQVIGSYAAGYIASGLSGEVPLVIKTHGEDIQKDAGLRYGKRLDPRIEGRIAYALSKADKVIGYTKSALDCCRELGVPDDKLVEIPIGVDYERFNNAAEKAALREKRGLPADRVVLLTVGRNHPKKNYAIIPQVAKVLKEKGLKFYWLIVGRGTGMLGEQIVREGLADMVHTKEEVSALASSDRRVDWRYVPGDELVDLYKCADMFVFPSLLETQGAVLVEAMAAGLAVVASNVAGCRDVLTQGKDGMLVGPRDAQGFADVVLCLASDRNLRQRLVSEAKKRAREYDWHSVIDKYEELYAGLVHKKTAVKKICFIAPKAYPIFCSNLKSKFGGAEVQLLLLAKECAKEAALQVSMLVGDYRQQPVEYREGIELIRAVYFKKNIFSQIYYFYRAFKKVDADVYVHTSLTPFSWVFMLYAKLRRKKMIYRVSHNAEADGGRSKKDGFFKYLFAPLVFSLADEIIVQNEYQKFALEATAKRKVRLIKTGYPIPAPAPVKKDIVLWVSRHETWKNPDLFLRLAQEFPEQKFVMICQRSLGGLGRFQATVKKARGMRNVEFIGYVPFARIETYFARAKIFVNTSRQEGFPNTFIQSCVAQTPILSFAVNPDNFLTAYRCGICAEGGWGKFREGFIELLNEGRARECGENGRRYAQEYHNIKNIVEEYKKLF